MSEENGNHNNKEDHFIDDYEDWHNRKYSDEYRYKNKTPFFFNNPNRLVNGILFLIIPFLSLVISIVSDFGTGICLFFLLLCIPGVYQIAKHFK